MRELFYDLTEAQKRIWHTQMVYPQSSMFHIGGTVIFNSAIDLQVLKEAIIRMVKNHDSFQIRIRETNGRYVQYFEEEEVVAVDFRDFSSTDKPEERLNQWKSQVAGELFVYESSPLYYFSLFKLNEEKMGYLVKLHHVIADGWSLQILSNDVIDLYRQIKRGSAGVAERKSSYKQFIAGEKEYLSSPIFENNKAFWLKIFSSLPDIKPFDSYNNEGKRISFYLGPDESAQLRQLCSENKISLNVFFIFLYILYEYKAKCLEDIVIGSPVLGRSGRKEREIFGMCVSSLPFRFKINPDETLQSMAKRVYTELGRCYMHQRYPLNQLIRDLELSKKGYHHIYNTCVNYYSTKMQDRLDDITVSNEEFYNGQQEYALQIIIREWAEDRSIQLDFDYKTELYSESDITRMYKSFRVLIQKFADANDALVRNTTMLTKSHEERLLQFNRTACSYPDNLTVINLIEEQILRHPNRTALELGDEHLSYEQLGDQMAAMASIIKMQNNGKSMVVGVLAHHSIKTVIAVLGILKAGYAYLPLDPANPRGRLEQILKNAGVNLLITDSEHCSGLAPRLLMLETLNLYRMEEAQSLPAGPNTEDTAYVIYTSGSTGQPKGVVIGHRALMNYVWWAKKMYVKNALEIFPLYTSLAFDLTVTSIFVPLISGGKIILYPEQQDEYVVNQIMRENKVTVMKVTPAHLSLMSDMYTPECRIRTLVVGGDDLKADLAGKIYHQSGETVEIYNEYGPTEATVGCMIHRFNQDEDSLSVPIGKPIDNTKIYIFDRAMCPVPPNTLGELYIGGIGLAREYLHAPELTDQRFVSHPQRSEERLYKTGDLGWFSPEFIVHYAGRSDRQIKINGYRIEIGEIERRLAEYPGIKEVVVKIWDRKVISAYYTADEGTSQKAVENYMKEHVPGYMLPHVYQCMQRLPLTVNGKVDFQGLPKPYQERKALEESQVGEKERILLAVLREKLGVDSIGAMDHFYYLGGDSIKAIQVSGKLKEFGYTLKTQDILSNPVIREMAAFMKTQQRRRKGPCHGIIEKLPVVSWFFQAEFYNPNYYNQGVLLRITGKQQVDWGNLLALLVRRHDALRISYCKESATIYYNEEAKDIIPDIRWCDLSEIQQNQRRDVMEAEICHVNESFHLGSGLLIKGCYFFGGANEYLYLCAHHLVVDGVSWRILLADMEHLLESLPMDRGYALPEQGDSYQVWVNALYSRGFDMFRSERDYWARIIRWASYESSLKNENDGIRSEIVTAESLVDTEDTRRLLTEANSPFHTETLELLVCTLMRSLSRVERREKVAVKLEGHGREELFEDIDILNTVGWFTSFYPYTVALAGSLEEQIKTVRQTLRSVPNKGIGYGILAERQALPSLDINELVSFNYMGEFLSDDKNPFFCLEEQGFALRSDKRNHLPAFIDINGYVYNRRLRFSFSFDIRRVKAEKASELVRTFEQELGQIIQCCLETKNVDITVSDFDIEMSREEFDGLFA